MHNENDTCPAFGFRLWFQLRCAAGRLHMRPVVGMEQCDLQESFF